MVKLKECVVFMNRKMVFSNLMKIYIFNFFIVFFINIVIEKKILLEVYLFNECNSYIRIWNIILGWLFYMNFIYFRYVYEFFNFVVNKLKKNELIFSNYLLKNVKCN